MTKIYLCGGEDKCAIHGNRIMPGLGCHLCQKEWAKANPLHRQAISDFVAHKITLEKLREILAGPGKPE